MIKKEDLLSKDTIKIKSYNYEKSKGFEQETAVEAHHGVYKEHKFIVEIKGRPYALEFLHSRVDEHYAAMEDEFVKSDRTIIDESKLTIRKLDDRENLIDINILHNIDDDIIEFRDRLVKAAESLGVGVVYYDHINIPDDYLNTYSDTPEKAPFTISDEVLFINNNEKDLFDEFLSLETKEEENKFFLRLEIKNSLIDVSNNEDDDLDIEFDSKNDWIDYQYTKPRNQKERFQHLKTYINNELNHSIIPDELKSLLGVKLKIKNTEEQSNKSKVKPFF